MSALIKNMINGVTKGFRYKMRLVHAHFPIKTEIPNDAKSIILRNFLGGKQDKIIKCKQGVTIKIDDEIKDMLIINGIDNANVSLTAALINQSVTTGRKDNRKFLDGIYIQDRLFADEDDSSKNQ